MDQYYSDEERVDGDAPGPSRRRSSVQATGHDTRMAARSRDRERDRGERSEGNSTAGGGGDGFLGDVARWRDDHLSEGNGGFNPRASRNSRLVGGKLGLSPPPPPGPPPSEPPPLPPSNSSGHPFASSSVPSTSGNTARNGPGPYARAAGRFSSINPLRTTSMKTSTRSAIGAPLAPPPSTALPPTPSTPTSIPSTRPTPTTPGSENTLANGIAGITVGMAPPRVKHNRTSSLASLHSHLSNASPSANHDGRTKPARATSISQDTPPGSPSTTGGGPSISPRTSSLFNRRPSAPEEITAVQPQGQRRTDAGPSGSTGNANTNVLGFSTSGTASTASHSTSGSKGTRTPSRQLLQSALDLAQQAVELDRDNDVHGALQAYTEAVMRLRHVMERVGVEPSSAAGRSDDGKKRKQSGKAEEEGRTLRGIHDAYVARIQLLSSYEAFQEGEYPEEDPNHQEYQQHLANPSSFPFTSTSSSTLTPSDTNRSTQSQTSASAGDRTPRPSIDGSSTGHGIGDLMMNGDVSEIVSPPRPGHPQTTESKAKPIDLTTSPDDTLRNLPPLENLRIEDQQRTRPFSVAPQIDMSLSPTAANDFLAEALNGVSIDTPPIETSSSVLDPMGLANPSSPPRNQNVTTTPQSSTPSKFSNNTGVFPYANTDSPSRIKKLSSRPIGLDEEAGLPDVLTEPEPMEMLDQAPSQASHSRSSSLDKVLPHIPLAGPLLDQFTSRGKGHARKSSRPLGGSISSIAEIGEEASGDSQRFPKGSAAPTSNTPASPFGLRIRARSQPGQKNEISSATASIIPPVPPLQNHHRQNLSHSSNTFPRGLRINIGNNGNGNGHGGDPALAPPATIGHGDILSTPRSLAADTASIAPSLISPIPESQPFEVLHRPYHVLRVLHHSMDETSPGAYLTGSIHISSAVWRSSVWSKPLGGSSSHTGGSGGNKKDNSSFGTQPIRIHAQEVKVRVMHQLLLHLTIIRSTTGGLLDGIREYKYQEIQNPPPPMLGVGPVIRIAAEFESALEALEEEMEGCYKTLVKAGVGVGGWKGKKEKASGGGGWGNQFRSKMGGAMSKDKVTDSPEKYVDLLETFCASMQILDHHLLCVTGPCTPGYHALPDHHFKALELRLIRCSEFVAAAIIPFVLDDMKQFFMSYLKSGVRYLED